ncbi:MAG: ABC transporter substrate-binding protein [Abditibacteriota bacterium]|nr:ABC transporter substrate-binding protein [Abditibacteriota bacterium]
MKRLSLLLLALVIAAGLLTGCGDKDKETAKNAAGSYTVTDMTGKTLNFVKPPKRIVAMNPSDITNLIALGCLDMLVGRGEFCDSPSVIKSLPKVGTGANTNVEEIVMLKPDLVIMSTMAQNKTQSEALEKAGINVLTLKSEKLDDIPTAISLIAECLNKKPEGEEAVSAFWTRLQDLKDKCQGSPFAGKTVYFEVSPLSQGLWAAGGSTFINETGKLLGLKNIFQKQAGWIQVSEEQVISRDPDIIVTMCYDPDEKEAMIQEICSRKGWDKIKAVREGRVFVGYSDKLSQPSMALADGAEELAATLFDAFEK